MQSIIQLNRVPNQEGSFNITNEAGKIFSINYSIRLLTTGSLCITLAVDDVVYTQSKIIKDRMPLLLNNIIGGNLYFMDEYGQEDPDYNEFNERFQFIYDTEFKLG
jgi:hypothetical protein